MKSCLFCQSNGPFLTIEHVIPESLGNDDLLLRGEICDSCQAYFGKEVEQYVLNKTPIGFWRTFLGIKTKKGKDPSVDLSEPKEQKGVLPSKHPLHDNIGFAYHEDGSVSIDIDDAQVVEEIADHKRQQFTFVFTPKSLHMLGRFLCKVGVELICIDEPQQARSDTLLAARRFARFGRFEGLWPIFHFSKGHPQELKRWTKDEQSLLEEVDCYSFSIIDFRSQYLLFRFTMGVDNFIISLNDPYPHPVIREAFPDDKLDLIWYKNQQW